jgi:hypothetical protein
MAYRFKSCPDYLCCSLEKGMSRESLLQLTSTTQRTSHPQHSQVAELVDAMLMGAKFFKMLDA